MLQKHIAEIKSKIQKIKEHNEKLKRFNYKMESLLMSIETFSILKKDNLAHLKYNDTKIQQKYNQAEKQDKSSVPLENKQEGVRQEKSDVMKIANILQKEQNMNLLRQDDLLHSDISHTTLDVSLLFESKNKLLSQALLDENINKANKGHLIKILDILNKNKGGILWEEIIRSSGVPRYKCIEILNCLMKADPPIMIKRRDKGFTCFLNTNQNMQ